MYHYIVKIVLLTQILNIMDFVVVSIHCVHKKVSQKYIFAITLNSVQISIRFGR